MATAITITRKRTQHSIASHPHMPAIVAMSYHHHMTTLDPNLPLPIDTGLPQVRQGEGKKILKDDGLNESGMTNRAFFMVWEQVERRAAENYPKYVGGVMDHVAQAWLEAAVWFRSKAHPGLDIEVIPEAKAQKIRSKEASPKKPVKKAPTAKSKNDLREVAKKAPRNGKKAAQTTNCPKCGDAELIETVTKKGLPVWKCFECGHKWPREAPAGPSKALDGNGSTPDTSGKGKKAKRPKKKGKKVKQSPK